MKAFIDRDIIPKLPSALRRHCSIKLTLGCKANLVKNEEIADGYGNSMTWRQMRSDQKK